jgi:hypothetical protein
MFKYFIPYEKYEINRCIRGKFCATAQVGSGECQRYFGRLEHADIGGFLAWFSVLVETRE